MKNNKRPLLFLGVGGFNTTIDFLFYTFLNLVIFKGSSLILAGILSGTVALITAFLTHSFITWRGSKIGPSIIIKFLIFTGFGMWVLRPILLIIFSNFNSLYDLVFRLGDSINLPFTKNFIASTGSFGFMIVVLLIYNYVVYERYVFSNQTED